MQQPDFAGAREYALERLARQLSPSLVYHSLAHTRDDVVPAVERLADLAGVSGEDRLLLLTAAYFHDIGFVEQREDHELAGVRILREVLPRLRYDASQVDRISRMVLATQLPQSPQCQLEQLLADADLDVLGREDYWSRNDDLRAEWAAFGVHFTDQEWYQNQLSFLQGHRYFTEAARRLRDEQKQANVQRLKLLLAERWQVWG